MKKTNGFTLVELMIVLAMIGILAAGVVGVFANNSSATEERAYETMQLFIDRNNITGIKRKTCAHDSDGYSSCTLVTEDERIYLQCPSSAFTRAKSCKEVPALALQQPIRPVR